MLGNDRRWFASFNTLGFRHTSRQVPGMRASDAARGLGMRVGGGGRRRGRGRKALRGRTGHLLVDPNFDFNNPSYAAALIRCQQPARPKTLTLKESFVSTSFTTHNWEQVCSRYDEAFAIVYHTTNACFDMLHTSLKMWTNVCWHASIPAVVTFIKTQKMFSSYNIIIYH